MRMLRTAARDVAQWARWLLGAVVGLAIVLLLAGGGLLWRLGQGPLDVTTLARWLAAREAPDATLDRMTVELQPSPAGRVVRIAVAALNYPADGAEPGGTLRSGTVALLLRPLLARRLAPQDMTLDGLHVQVAASTFGAGGPGRPAGWQVTLAGLRRVSLTDGELALTDSGAGDTVHVRAGAAELTRGDDGAVAGHAAAVAAIANASVQVEADAAQAADSVQLTVATSPVSPAALAKAVPALAALGALDAAISLRIEASLDPAMTLRHVAVHAESGSGSVQLPAKGGGTSTGQFASMALDAEGDLQSVTLRQLRLVLAAPSGNPPTTVLFSGDAARTGERLTAHVVVDIDRFIAGDLAGLWPARVGGDSRAWLTENVTAGLIHDGHITFTLTGAANGDDMDLTQAGGVLTGDDVTVWWLRPVPPVEHGRVAVVWQDPDTLLLTVTGARQGAIVSRLTTVKLTGLAGNHQFANIEAELAGPLAAVFTLLKHPRLNLLSKHPVPITNPSGMVTDQLSVRLPLEANVDIDHVPIRSHGQVADAHLGGIVAGRDLDHGQLTVDVTNDALNVTGAAQIDHIPATLTEVMDFRLGPPSQVVQHATASLRVGERDASAAGLGVVGLDAGVVIADVDYAEQRNGSATIGLHADVTGAGFHTPLGWAKAVGSAGHVEARVLLSNGRLAALDQVRADAPGLSVAARTDVAAGRPAVVHIERGDVGRTSATGQITLPQSDGDPYRVTLAGRQLDLEGRLVGHDSGPAPSFGRTGGSASPYLVDLRFDRVVLGPDRGIGPLALTARGDGKRLASARLTLAGPDPALVTLRAAGEARELHAEAANLGMLLRMAGYASEIDGGALRLDGRFEDRQPGSPFDGTLDLRNFKVRGAPVVGKLLQGVTLYGLVDALRGPGLVFDRLATQVRLDGSVLDVKDARAFSSSLGVTASGRLDFGRKLVALNGTIVPAYFFNALPGRIPLIGRLFSPEKGSGVFAANYSLKGSLTDPAVSINPLAALTPGFLRGFFDLF